MGVVKFFEIWELLSKRNGWRHEQNGFFWLDLDGGKERVKSRLASHWNIRNINYPWDILDLAFVILNNFYPKNSLYFCFRFFLKIFLILFLPPFHWTILDSLFTLFPMHFLCYQHLNLNSSCIPYWTSPHFPKNSIITTRPWQWLWGPYSKSR